MHAVQTCPCDVTAVPLAAALVQWEPCPFVCHGAFRTLSTYQHCYAPYAMCCPGEQLSANSYCD